MTHPGGLGHLLGQGRQRPRRDLARATALRNTVARVGRVCQLSESAVCVSWALASLN
jgi:hypothetical protein